MNRLYFAIITAFALIILVSGESPSDRTHILRISTENIDTHFQTQSLKQFSSLVSQRLGPSFNVEFYTSANLFRDANAVCALANGELEMAAPGIWQFDRFVPDTAVFMLPSMYSRSSTIVRAIVDGPLGDVISRKIEDALSVIVIGPWLDLGYGNIFGVQRPIKSSADIRDKHIRVSGGRGNEERILALGGIPMSIPFLDLPAYLERGLIDGILTTYETIDSALLDRYGIFTALEDKEYYPFYVPLVSKKFWLGLTEEQRTIIRSSWAEVVAAGRIQSERSQESAKSNLIGRGLKIYTMSSEEASQIRETLLEKEDEMARRLNVSQEIMNLLHSEIERRIDL